MLLSLEGSSCVPIFRASGIDGSLLQGMTETEMLEVLSMAGLSCVKIIGRTGTYIFRT